MSKATLQVEGYLSGDPKSGTTGSGDRFLSFTVPHTPRRKNRDSGEWEDAGDTLWVQVTLWREDADRFAPHLRKGVQVRVEGEPTLRLWESQSKSGANLDVKFASVSIVPDKSQRPVDRPLEPVSQPSDSWTTPEGGGGFDDSSTPF